MQVGLALPQLGGHVTRHALRTFCERAEELGFDSLWVQEHLFYPLEPTSGYSARPGLAVPDVYRSVLGALETLAAVAAWTTRPLLGTSVLVAGLHRPVQLAQRLSTIDVLSEGRLITGFSVGWSHDEHHVVEVDPRTRGARCDELIDALVACWGPDPVEYEGEFFSIPRSIVQPKPLQAPRPRLMSGMSSKAGMRRTAEKFDIWNPASGTLEQNLDDLATLQAMRPEGKEPLTMFRRLFTHPPVRVRNLRPLSLDELAEEVRAARDAGVEAVLIDANFDPVLDHPDRWVEVPGRLSALVEIAHDIGDHVVASVGTRGGAAC